MKRRINVLSAELEFETAKIRADAASRTSERARLMQEENAELKSKLDKLVNEGKKILQEDKKLKLELDNKNRKSEIKGLYGDFQQAMRNIDRINLEKKSLINKNLKGLNKKLTDHNNDLKHMVKEERSKDPSYIEYLNQLKRYQDGLTSNY